MISQFVPPLERMAAMRIAQIIYYDKDIEKLLEDAFKKSSYTVHGRVTPEFWDLLETKTIEKLPFLPDLLKIRVSKKMKPIHEAAFRWTSNHKVVLDCHFVQCYLTCKSALSWKTDGTIDRLETAKKLAGNENICPNARFRMACTYFLKDEVLAIWYKDDKVYKMYRPPQTTSQGAVGFWVKYLSTNGWWRESWKAMIREYFRIPWISHTGASLSVKWFFSYLSWEDKKDYFETLQIDFIKSRNFYEYGQLFNVRYVAVHEEDLRFCLQAMDKRERWEVLSQNPVKSLLCCLMSPLQFSFLEMANKLCGHMDKDMFVDILRKIPGMRYTVNSEGYDYIDLLKEFWDIIPLSCKKEIKKNLKFYKYIEEVMMSDKKKNTLTNFTSNILEVY